MRPTQPDEIEPDYRASLAAERVEQAMREQRPLPRSGLAHSLAWALVLIAVGAVVVTLTV